MNADIFDKAGKNLPYVMPEGFDVTQLMQEAISREQSERKAPRRRIFWLGSSAAAVAAVALLMLFFKPAMRAADPTSDYQAALLQYCNTASDAEIQKRCDIQDADYMANIDHYEAYFVD